MNKVDKQHNPRVKRFNSRPLRNKVYNFQRATTYGKYNHKHHHAGKITKTFSWRDIIDRFGWQTQCYLTGEEIDIKDTKNYHFDHIIPVSRGGDFHLDNLGITTPIVNKLKGTLLTTELINLCKKILEHQGYTVTKNR